MFAGALLAVAGCAADEGGSGGSRGPGGTVNPGPGAGSGMMSGGAGTSAGAAGDDGFGNGPVMGVKPRDMPMMMRDPNACQSVGMKAETGLAAVDIVWIIDGSGSMIDEAQRLQQNLDKFTMTISASGVDTRVVLVGPDDLVPMGSMLASSGNYRFVKDDVDSFNALDRLIARFADYQSFLRPNAHVHFIIVTDDESRYMGLGAPTERANGFRTAMDDLLASSFTIHAIASEGKVGDPPCLPVVMDPVLQQCCVEGLFGLLALVGVAPSATCQPLAMKINPVDCPPPGGAAAPGVTYQELVTATKGVFASICSTDWSMVFSSLSDAVIKSAPLPCNYPIPPPPAGMSLDRSKVNVKYTPQGADPATVMPYGKVTSADQCGDLNAWYYNDEMAPTEVLLCPSACTTVGAGNGGQVDVLFGCATVGVM